ncbi:Protein CBR-UNC-40 [Anopheles sinensis]|uniref:Protein CBR-UNC-40 n=1 Tax=Anopheles sinensis TaxID=74873 RepID=A0A084WNH6_ANOSI|nr:Protein CBR-UNC-40 [Anopheles sinensis]
MAKGKHCFATLQQQQQRRADDQLTSGTTAREGKSHAKYSVIDFPPPVFTEGKSSFFRPAGIAAGARQNMRPVGRPSVERSNILFIFRQQCPLPSRLPFADCACANTDQDEMPQAKAELRSIRNF